MSLLFTCPPIAYPKVLLNVPPLINSRNLSLKNEIFGISLELFMLALSFFGTLVGMFQPSPYIKTSLSIAFVSVTTLFIVSTSSRPIKSNLNPDILNVSIQYLTELIINLCALPLSDAISLLQPLTFVLMPCSSNLNKYPGTNASAENVLTL